MSLFDRRKNCLIISCLLIIVNLYGFTTISLLFPILQEVDGRCPNGYHKSPSGDCEKVTDTKGMPKCPDGYHRSPDGDCEKVSKFSSEKSVDPDDDDEDNIDFTKTKKEKNKVYEYNSPLNPNF